MKTLQSILDQNITVEEMLNGKKEAPLKVWEQLNIIGKIEDQEEKEKKDFIQMVHDLPVKEIAKQIRKDLKLVFWKDFKFSVTSNYNKIEITAKSGNKEVYTPEYKGSSTWEEFQELRENDRRLKFQPEVRNFKGMKFSYTEFGMEFSETLQNIIKKYNHDNSDAMTDYFDVNYYTNIHTDSYKAS